MEKKGLMDKTASQYQTLQTLEDIQLSFSGHTVANILEEEARNIEQNSTDDIGILVESLLENGVDTKLKGESIINAINKNRADVLKKSFFDISKKIINDVFVLEARKHEFNRVSLEDIIISAKIADLLKKKDIKEVLLLIKSILPEGHSAISVDDTLKNEINKNFLNDGYSGLILMEMFYKYFHEEKKEKKPAVHAPIFESVISYV